jgi:hypothetical protein
MAREKAFKLAADQIVKLIPGMGYCYATDRITVDGTRVGYMYRETPDDEYNSGWRFFAGDETQEYVDAPEHHGLYDVNTICNYDRDIIPFLHRPPDVAFERDPVTGDFVKVAFHGD